MGKKLSEIFKKYVPDNNTERMLLADGEVEKSKWGEDKKSFVVQTKFSRIYSKKKLYQTEENLRVFYDMKFIRISPVYDAELLSEDYFKEIFIECSTRKGMTRGMIRSYTADFDGDTITLNIKQTDSGMSLINNANSASIISDVIFDEFGIRRKIILNKVESDGDDYDLIEREAEAAEKEAMEKAVEKKRFCS